MLDKALSILNGSREQRTGADRAAGEAAAGVIHPAGRRIERPYRRGCAAGPYPAQRPCALELEFAVFTLLLIKLTELPLSSRRSTSDMALLSFRVKDLLAQGRRGAGKAVAFHNVYSHDEFILLTDLDKAGIDRVCELAAGSAGAMHWSPA